MKLKRRIFFQEMCYQLFDFCECGGELCVVKLQKKKSDFEVSVCWV